MANKKITELGENTTPATEDLLAQVDDPSGTPVTKKVTVQNLLKVIPTLTVNTTPASGDYLVMVDDPGGSPDPQHITIANVLKAILTTNGDILYRDNSGNITRLGIGSPANVLSVTGAGTGLEWSAAAGGGGGAAALVNQSGSTIPTAAVVIYSGTANNSFTMGSIYWDRRVVGVTGSQVNPGGTSSILIGPQKAEVLAMGPVSRGQWLVHADTAYHATAWGYVRPPGGAIGVATSSLAGTAAGTVDAMLDPDIAGRTIDPDTVWFAGARSSSTVQAHQGYYTVANDTYTNQGNVWMNTLYRMGGGETPTELWTFGGHTPTNDLDKLTFATGTGASVTTTTNTNQSGGICSDWTGDKMYQGACYGMNNDVGKFIPSTTTYSFLSNVWPTNVDYAADNGVYSESQGKGYWFGGMYGTSNRNMIVEVNWSTDAVADNGANSTYNAGYRSGGIEDVDGDRAIICGGFDNTSTYLDDAEKFVYSTETATAIGNMPGASAQGSSGNGSGTGYSVTGEYASATSADKVYLCAFSTDTWSTGGDAYPTNGHGRASGTQLA